MCCIICKTHKPLHLRVGAENVSDLQVTSLSPDSLKDPPSQTSSITSSSTNGYPAISLGTKLLLAHCSLGVLQPSRKLVLKKIQFRFRNIIDWEQSYQVTDIYDQAVSDSVVYKQVKTVCPQIYKNCNFDDKCSLKKIFLITCRKCLL